MVIIMPQRPLFLRDQWVFHAIYIDVNHSIQFNGWNCLHLITVLQIERQQTDLMCLKDMFIKEIT